MSDTIYVARDEEGAIIRVSEEPEDGMESAAISDPEIRHLLATSDLELVRVLEDVVELLMAQGVFRFTDLPVIAQEKLLKRKKARCLLSDNPSILVDDDVL